MATDLWKFSSDVGHERADLAGMKVEAVDGAIGKVESVMDSPQGTALVVDTGPWIFGKKVMLPAGVVSAIDVDDESVKVDRTKEEIKSAPELDDTLLNDAAYQEALTRHYGATSSSA
jgi:PRC-barrel domain